jgi:hypothetical protein
MEPLRQRLGVQAEAVPRQAQPGEQAISASRSLASVASQTIRPIASTTHPLERFQRHVNPDMMMLGAGQSLTPFQTPSL